MDIISDLDKKLAAAVSHVKNQLAGIRGGRPTTALVEGISIELYGQKLSVKQLGSTVVVPPREIQISVWDPQSTAVIVKGIESTLNVGTNVEGNVIHVNLPPLSGERRNELLKLVKREIEDVRIAVRALRDEANKAVQKALDDKTISEDDKFKTKEKIQKSVDVTNQQIEALLEGKIKELEE